LAANYRYYSGDEDHELQERQFFEDKRRQPGISFPSALKQQHVLIIRLDLNPEVTTDKVRSGLKSLCSIFENIYSRERKILEIGKDGEEVYLDLSVFNFTSTIGFGQPFFEKLDIPRWNRPNFLHSMPNHLELGDPLAYTLRQTDILIQLASSSDYINRWIYEYSSETSGHGVGSSSTFSSYAEADTQKADIVSAIQEWASVQDLHVGFQRVDGRNLLGFKDGISNPHGLQLNDVVWTIEAEESNLLADGTYMVFQKIEHDLEKWRKLPEEEQEKLIGRSKGTGLLLGTLTKIEDQELADQIRSKNAIEAADAKRRLKELLDPQRNPFTTLSRGEIVNSDRIKVMCPVWSHARKSNPREADDSPSKVIFRRGYLYSDADSGSYLKSGLLFICFQKNIGEGFEFIKKNWLNNKDFPIPRSRPFFNESESLARRSHARFSEEELIGLSMEQRKALGLVGETFRKALEETRDIDTQNTGRDGLTGPSKLGVHPRNLFFATRTLGGGYYFVPPIPNKDISLIGESFFS
jgi:Dyp-type peroxidase family